MNETDSNVLCRICLNESNLFFNIYERRYVDDSPIFEVINYVYDLDISIDDGLAEHVCNECLRIVKDFEKYKRIALRNRNKLILLKDKSETMLDSKADVFNDAVGINCSEDVKVGCINYVEFHGMMPSAINGPAGEVRNSSDGNLKSLMEFDSYEKSESKSTDSSCGKDPLGEEEMRGNVPEVNRVCIEREPDKEINAVYVKSEPVEGGVNPEDFLSNARSVENRKILERLKEICEDSSSVINEKRGSVKSGKQRKIHGCSYCNKWYTNKSSLAQHLRIHRKEDKSSLNLSLTHIQSQPEKKIFTCYLCQYRCSTKSVLRSHILIHSGEKPFKCTLCGFSSSYKSSLTGHIRSHFKDMQLKCDLCDFSCSTRSHLNRHNIIHSKDKPFKCNICGHGCSTSTKLKIHYFSHSEDKPFKCDVCEYSCATRSRFKTHYRIHTNERPFQCDLCHYSTTTASNLKRHYIMHSKEKPF